MFSNEVNITTSEIRNIEKTADKNKQQNNSPIKTRKFSNFREKSASASNRSQNLCRGRVK